MGFNRRKMEDQRREAAAIFAAIRRPDYVAIGVLAVVGLDRAARDVAGPSS
jgi:hypothetical protein